MVHAIFDPRSEKPFEIFPYPCIERDDVTLTELSDRVKWGDIVHPDMIGQQSSVKISQKSLENGSPDTPKRPVRPLLPENCCNFNPFSHKSFKIHVHDLFLQTSIGNASNKFVHVNVVNVVNVVKEKI